MGHEDEPRHLGDGSDGHALQPGRLQARACRSAARPRHVAQRRSRASASLIDDYEFHYPQELSDDNLDEVREALDGHGIYAIASGLHLDNRFARGGLSSPDDAIREEALKLTLAVRGLRRLGSARG